MLLKDYRDPILCLANRFCFNALWNLIIVLEARLQVTPHAQRFAIDEVGATKKTEAHRTENVSTKRC